MSDNIDFPQAPSGCFGISRNATDPRPSLPHFLGPALSHIPTTSSQPLAPVTPECPLEPRPVAPEPKVLTRNRHPPSLAKISMRPIARGVPCDCGSYYRSSRGVESRHILRGLHRHNDHFVLAQGRPRSGLSTKAALHQQPRTQDRPLFQRS